MSPNDQATQNLFDEFNRLYRFDSVKFVREVFGVEPYDDQIELLRHYDRRERYIAKRSGHGTGKSTGDAWIIIHHALFNFPQKTVVTAPTATQLFKVLAADTKAWILRLPPLLQELFEIKSESIELKAAPNDSFVSFATSRPETPEAIAGVHSMGSVLLVVDEASGVHDAVFEAGSGSMSGHNAMTLLTGNPVRSSGFFYDVFHKNRADWITLHVSCVNHPNVAPDFVDKMAKRYGERSNAYRVRVLGEFPMADDDTVIPFELAETALTRDVRAAHVREVWGLDCARFGNDSSALAKRKGNVLKEKVLEKHGLDTMQLVGWVKRQYDDCKIDERPVEINVDVIGLGAGVVDRGRELGLPIRGVNVAESPALGDEYLNLRAELWFEGREWLARRDCNLAGDDGLVEELIGPKYKFTSSGKKQVEGKEEMKKRGLESPNKADAFLLTFATPAAIASMGSAGSTSWKTPIKRLIKGLV